MQTRQQPKQQSLRTVNRRLELETLRALAGQTDIKSLEAASRLSEDDFQHQDTRTLFRVMRARLKTLGALPNWEALTQSFELSPAHRESLGRDWAKVSIGDTPLSLSYRLQEVTRLRQLTGLLQDVYAKLKPDTPEGFVGDPSALLAEVRAKIGAIKDIGESEDITTTIGVLDDNSGRMAMESAFELDESQYMATGFDSFDLVNGGVPRGACFVIGANTGAGKSIMCGQLAHNMGQRGGKATVIPLEMSRMEMLQRELARQSKVPLSRIRRAKKLTIEEKETIRHAFDDYTDQAVETSGALRFHKPNLSLTIENLLASARALGSDVIIVDYIGLLDGVGGEEQWRKLPEVTKFCKKWAERENAIVILAAQMDSKTREIRYARGLKEDASLMWTWHLSQEERAERDYVVTKVNIEKSRNQISAPFWVTLDMPTMTFADATLEQAEAEGEEGYSLNRMAVKILLEKAEKEGRASSLGFGINAFGSGSDEIAPGAKPEAPQPAPELSADTEEGAAALNTPEARKDRARRAYLAQDKARAEEPNWALPSPSAFSPFPPFPLGEEKATAKTKTEPENVSVFVDAQGRALPDNPFVDLSDFDPAPEEEVNAPTPIQGHAYTQDVAQDVGPAPATPTAAAAAERPEPKAEVEPRQEESTPEEATPPLPSFLADYPRTFAGAVEEGEPYEDSLEAIELELIKAKANFCLEPEPSPLPAWEEEEDLDWVLDGLEKPKEKEAADNTRAHTQAQNDNASPVPAPTTPSLSAEPSQAQDIPPPLNSATITTSVRGDVGAGVINGRLPKEEEEGPPLEIDARERGPPF